MNAISNTPASSLQEETLTAQALLELLKQEQARLIAADIDQLPLLIEEKAKLVARMTTLANTRYTALAAAGFEPREAGMKTWIDQNTGKAGQAWNQLISLAQAAKELNRLNGILINRHISNNQMSLNVLRGNTGQAFYGPNGQSSVNTTVRGLAIG